MKFLVIFLRPSLVFHILCNGGFISVTTDSADEISLRPKLAAPKDFFHCWNSFEDFSCCYTFDYPHYFSRAIIWYGLNQEMHMVLFHPNFNEDNFITLGDLKTNILESCICFVKEYDSPIFGGADQMIQQYRYIMASMGIFTHAVQLTINKKAEASFGELDPERLKFEARQRDWEKEPFMDRH